MTSPRSRTVKVERRARMALSKPANSAAVPPTKDPRGQLYWTTRRQPVGWRLGLAHYERNQRVLLLRFYGNLTQDQIGAGHRRL
jgi:hypothetical protein